MADDSQLPAKQEIQPPVPYLDDRILSPNEVVAQTLAVREIQKRVMTEGVHYGKIPGMKEDAPPMLFKPGADKLILAFRLAPKAHVEDLSTSDVARFRVRVDLYSIKTGKFLGSCERTASSSEEKWKWKKCTIEEEFNETPEDKRREKWYHGKPKPYKVKQIRTNPDDMADTVLAMAQKRAISGAVKIVLGISDLFSDEELDNGNDKAGGEGSGEGEKAAGSVKPPQKKAPAQQEGTKPATAKEEPKAAVQTKEGEVPTHEQNAFNDLWTLLHDPTDLKGVDEAWEKIKPSLNNLPPAMVNSLIQLKEKRKAELLGKKVA